MKSALIMDNLLPAFDLGSAPRLAIDEWDAKRAQPFTLRNRPRRTQSTKPGGPTCAPNDRLKLDPRPARRATAEERFAEFEARMNPKLASPYGVEPSPLSASMRGNPSQSTKESKPFSQTFLTESRSANPNRNKRSVKAESPFTRRSRSTDLVTARLHNCAERGGELYLTNGKNLKRTTVEAGAQCTCTVSGNPRPDNKYGIKPSNKYLQGSSAQLGDHGLELELDPHQRYDQLSTTCL